MLSGQAESNIQNPPIPSVSCDVETTHRSTSTVAAVNADGASSASLPGLTPQSSTV